MYIFICCNNFLFFSIGNQNENATLSSLNTYRSDLEIHAPEPNTKPLTKRPQSTTELVSFTNTIYL